MSFDEKLIALFEENSCLYDKKSKYYKDTVFKENIWRSISSAMVVDVEACQKRMKCLRERYGKEIKNLSKASQSGAGAPKKPEWPLLKSLAFLKDVIKTRDTWSNASTSQRSDILDDSGSESTTFDRVFPQALPQDVVSENGEEDGYEELVHLDAEESLLDPAPQSSPAARGKKRKREGCVEDSLRMVAEATKKFTSEFEKKKSANGDSAFAELVCANLSQLPEALKDETMMKIMELIFQAKRQAREDRV